MTIQAVAATPPFPQVTVITTSGAGSVTAPVGATRVTVEAIGGGGNGFGATAGGQRAGGGGGRFARTINLPVTGGTTIVYYSVGAASTRSWVNVGTNAAPASATTGCLAPAGTDASSGVPGSGASGTAIGTATANGGTGATGASAVGAGAAGAGATIAGTAASGSGQTAGTDTTGMSINVAAQRMGSGTGGVSLTAGTAPGGGGASSATPGVNPAGAIGRVRITFYG
jgi:hypothetical protein